MKAKHDPHPEDLISLISSLKEQDYCYLTTIGRVSGRPHQIEIWFGANRSTLYLLSGSEKSDWVRNLRKDPAVQVRIAEHIFRGTARLVNNKEEDRMARHLVAEKYQEWEEDQTLSDWARSALAVAIDLDSVDIQ
jgi:deazaflavin-dependent oxidoreductase (nitroreductase family)